jgi:hypothetical protein
VTTLGGLGVQACLWTGCTFLFKESLGEGHAGELFLETLAFSRVRSVGELVGQLEETAMLGFFRLQTSFDKVYEDATGARFFVFRQGQNAPGDAGWKRNALTDGIVNGGHVPIFAQKAGRHTSA